MIIVPPPTLVRARLDNHEQKDNYKEPTPPPKTYKYRLMLEVYEDEPLTIPNNRFCIDTILLYKDGKIVNEALRNTFERLLEQFNKKEKADE